MAGHPSGFPPTPGPLAAAALVGADLGKTIVFGGFACLVGSLACWLWGEYVAGPRIDTPPSAEVVASARQADRETRELPSTLASYLPIAVPVVLTQMSMTAMGFIDSAMVGRLGATELGAGAPRDGAARGS